MQSQNLKSLLLKSLKEVELFNFLVLGLPLCLLFLASRHGSEKGGKHVVYSMCVGRLVLLLLLLLGIGLLDLLESLR